MSSSDVPLDDLRQEIDRIDDEILDLLMQRTSLVEKIGAAKDPELPAIRPSREAVILRRLTAQHRGPLPTIVVVRLWRELIAGLTRLQGPYAVAVYAPADRKGFWDIARDHYGSATTMTPVDTPMAALRAVTDGTASIGVVPFPDDDDHDAWWRYLSAADPKTPRIVARLPFCGRGNARGDDRDALALALVPHEPTDDDRSLINIEVAADMSRGRLKDTLEAVGLPPISFCSWLGRVAAAGAFHLVEVADFVRPDDSRLQTLEQRLGPILVRAHSIGGYAVPLAIADQRKA